MSAPKLALFLISAMLLAAGTVRAQEVLYEGGQRVLELSAAEVPEGSLASWRVLGLGQTEREAIEDAIDKARHVVAAFMKKRDSNFAWTPDVEFVRRYLVDYHLETRRESDLDGTLQVGAHKITRKWYSVPIVIDEEDYQRLLAANRRYLAEQAQLRRDSLTESRLLLVSRIFAIVLVVCAAWLLSGILERRTKRPWLATAVSILLGSIAALGLVLWS